MEEKLQMLLKQIDMFKDNINDFEGGKLEKIIGNKSKTEYRFYITLKENLKLITYLEFEEKLKKKYSDFEKINAYFNVETKKEEYIKDYYNYFLDLYSKNSPLLAMFKDRKISYMDNKLTLELLNKAEELKLNGTKNDLEKSFKRAGYDLEIEIKIDEEKNKELREEINKELEINIPKETIKKEEPVVEKQKKYKNYKRPPLITDPTNEKIIVGKEIEDSPSRLDTVIMPGGTTVIEGYIFGKDVRETRTGLKIISLKITDYTDSIYGTLFVNDEEEFKIINKKIQVGSWYKIRASVKDKDQYNQDISLTIRDINVLKKEVEEIIDDAPVKRVELHAHTKMSQMDGVVAAKDLLKQALKWGHKAIAVTDHNGVQGFVDAYHFVRDYNKKLKEGEEPFKALYGTELTMIDDTVKIVVRPNDSKLLDNTYVVFDLETTGFNAGGEDSIIEIGAVKILNGEIIDRYDQLVDPGKQISQRITDVTSITNEMLVGKPNEETAIKEFKEWIADLPKSS